MELGPVTQIDKRNKKIDDDLMSANCDAIAVFPMYYQFEAIPKPYSGRIVCKTYIFIKSNLLSYKNWKQNQKNL